MDKRTIPVSVILPSFLLLFCSCQQQMARQPKVLPYAPSSFFPDGSSARPVPAGTVSRDDQLPSKHPPAAVNLKRGRERYEIYCTPCHDAEGTGHGLTTRHGFDTMEAFQTTRMRRLSDEALFETIRSGKGRMLGFGPRIPQSDRWHIIGWVRKLMSQPEKKP